MIIDPPVVLKGAEARVGGDGREGGGVVTISSGLLNPFPALFRACMYTLYSVDAATFPCPNVNVKMSADSILPVSPRALPASCR